MKFTRIYYFLVQWNGGPSRQLHVQSLQRKQNKVWNMFKVNNKDTPLTPCSSGSIVNFQQVNAGWGPMYEEHSCGWYWIYIDIVNCSNSEVSDTYLEDVQHFPAQIFQWQYFPKQ